VSENRVTVTVDDRVRLVMGVMAASGWPDQEQAIQTHAVHQHSKQTRQFVSEFRKHLAVSKINEGLAAGVSPGDFFTAALRCSWPDLKPLEPLPSTFEDGNWIKSLADFYQESAIENFWLDHSPFWEEARDDLDEIFKDSVLIQFLTQLLDQPMNRSVVVMPSIVYPMLTPIMAETMDILFFILPPAKAWGESPPWPFDEDPGWVIAQTCWHLTAYFMAGTLSKVEKKSGATLRHAAVTLCLEQEFDEAEAMAYLVRCKKEHGLPRLPLVVEELREYLADPGGRSLADLEF